VNQSDFRGKKLCALRSNLYEPASLTVCITMIVKVCGRHHNSNLPSNQYDRAKQDDKCHETPSPNCSSVVFVLPSVSDIIERLRLPLLDDLNSRYIRYRLYK